MKAYIRNLLLPGADSIMSSFTKAISALESKADASSELASQYRLKGAAAQAEADRASKIAIKLKSAFTI